jgi:dihydropyrimidine dehydrogenase (NAD+) subunit PreT
MCCRWDGGQVITTEGLAEQLPPLQAQEALVEANRCLFCYDAPCTHACPTHIDIPRFIKKISTDNLTGSARTILDANLLGATCARVCPVQELCEGACVLGSEHKPIMIGRLQRYAMDAFSARGGRLSTAAPNGHQVAVVGSGPAGLSCAGELARRGYGVTIYERRPLAGGLSTYGIISLREPVEASLAEVKMIEGLGVRIETGVELGVRIQLAELRERFEAVFLSVGLGATPAMGIEGEEHIVDGLEYIEQSKVMGSGMAVGRNVAIIGAGNTAIDCATVARRLGAEKVTMIYRRSEREMTAYAHEYEFVRKEGVEFRFLTQPVSVEIHRGAVTGLRAVRMELGPEDASARRTPSVVPGSEFVIAADQIVKAVGQEKPALATQLGLTVEKGYIQVDSSFETNLAGVFAGGDCIRAKNVASTVMAVQDGKLAARAIEERLRGVGVKRG